MLQREIRKYTEEEKIICVEEFKSSGMSLTEFSNLKNIPSSTLSGWIRLDKALAFGEIDLKSQQQGAVSAPIVKRTIMVFAKDDIRVELKEGFDKNLLKNIIEVLINAN